MVFGRFLEGLRKGWKAQESFRRDFGMFFEGLGKGWKAQDGFRKVFGGFRMFFGGFGKGLEGAGGLRRCGSVLGAPGFDLVLFLFGFWNHVSNTLVGVQIFISHGPKQSLRHCDCISIFFVLRFLAFTETTQKKQVLGFFERF